MCFMINPDVIDKQTETFAREHPNRAIFLKGKGEYLGYIVGYYQDHICYIPDAHMTDDDAIEFVPVVDDVFPGTTLVKASYIYDVELECNPTELPIPVVAPENSLSALMDMFNKMKPVEIKPMPLTRRKKNGKLKTSRGKS